MTPATAKTPLSTHGMTAARAHAELLANAVTTAQNPDPASTTPSALPDRTPTWLSLPMIQNVEDLASYGWDLPRVQHLLRQLALGNE